MADKSEAKAAAKSDPTPANTYKSVWEPKYKDSDVLPKLRKKLPTATRAGRGGQVYEYIPTKFVSDRLNDVWGIDWSLEIVNTIIEKGHVAVQARLHYPTMDGAKFKDAFGGAKYEEQVGLGDCLKKSASLALKKAASLIGIDLQDEEASPISDEQKQEIIDLLTKLGSPVNDEVKASLTQMSSADAEAVIASLKAKVSG